MVNRLQALFNRLAGVLDNSGLMQSQAGLGHPSESFADLERPACWRRSSRSFTLSHGAFSRLGLPHANS